MSDIENMVSSKFNLDCKVKNFQGGQVSQHYSHWEKLTSDSNILSIINGDTIFMDHP